MPRLFSTSVVRRIVAVSLLLLAVTTASIVGATYVRLSQHLMGQAVTDAGNANRTMAIIYGAYRPDARIAFADDALAGVTEDKVAPFADHAMVDLIARSIGGVATIFEKRGDDYVRVSTNVKQQNGERAVGTKLAADHPAQASLTRGEAYYGPADLFGRKFITGYFPIKNAAGANVGILFIGIPMEVYYASMADLLWTGSTIGAIVMLIAGFAAYFAIRASMRPLEVLTGSINRIAGGDLATDVPYAASQDEFGAIARALSIFRDNESAKLRMETEAAEQRALAEGERARNEEEKRGLDAQIEFAVTQLAGGLGRLARGDVSETIETPFIGRLEQLRTDFNGSLGRLQQTLSQIRDSAHSIHHNSGAMLHSADALQVRTESQAASLEETAAAVEEITVTVRSSAERASEADRAVSTTKKRADSSGAVVDSAVAAMGRIQDASQKIEQIIEVIDEIAFQTNLLALNAGIEAARAGDAGKGFAVVAQEVRELAQRSADAARQIKDLITHSSQEVTEGASLVQETGKVLAAISHEIIAISGHVEMIATASRDQSAALSEVNTSVNAMDEMTQKNAAMVQEAAAASRDLASEADALLNLVEQFRIDGPGKKGYSLAA